MDTFRFQVESSIELKTLAMDGYDIHYTVSGKEHDDLVVFLHPAFSDHRAFDQQIDYFSKDYRVVTIDLIGHGKSKANGSKDKLDVSVEHIRQIVEKQGVEKIHLVGVSMGSLVAQYFTLHYSAMIKTLTALGGYDINKANKDVARAQRNSNLTLIVKALFSMNAFRKHTARITCKSDKGRALFIESASLYTRKSFLVMQGLQHVIKERINSHPDYPTLILCGEYDIELALKMSKEWHTDLSNSRYRIIENAGHCANMDEPLEFNKIVKEFIAANNE